MIDSAFTEPRCDPKHPIQPLVTDDDGVIRFKANAIVQYLLDHGGIDLNQIAVLPFSKEDREQFAQLIGYSHSGASYIMSKEALCAAEEMRNTGKSELECRNEYLRTKLDEVKSGMKQAIAKLYDIADDFDQF